MTDSTFTCDRCGKEFPRDQMKEVFVDRQKMVLDPACLDEVMNESGTVRGVEGDEKQAAVQLEGEPSPDRETYGTRP
jgi:hypothetical protein